MRVFDYVHRSQHALRGQPNVLALGCFREGTLYEVSLQQVGGPSADFTGVLYSRQQAAAGFVSSAVDPESADEQTDAMGDPTLYKVGSTIAGTSGVGSFTSATGVPYCNADGGVTRAKNRIYLVLTPASGGGDQDTAWDVRVRGTSIPNV